MPVESLFRLRLSATPIRKVAVIKGPGEFGQSVGADAGLLGEDRSRGSRWGEADDLAAVFGPG